MNPYDLSTRELLNKFMNACARAGTSNSGLVISFSARSDLADAHYLRGAVLARMEGSTPPAKPGQKVKVNKEKVQPTLNNPGRHFLLREVPPVLTVEKVYYLGGNTWEYVFREKIEDVTIFKECVAYYEDGPDIRVTELRFHAIDFDLIEEPAPAPAA